MTSPQALLRYVRSLLALKVYPAVAPDSGLRRNQLLVDISILARKDAGTGIQRVVRALCEQLRDANLGDFDLNFVAATRNRRYHYLLNGLANEPKVGAEVQVNAGDIFLGLDLSSRILPRHPRQIRSWRARGVHICVFVYDLLPISNPEWFDGKQVGAFASWLHFIARYCDHALCISQTVATNFTAWLQHEKIKRRDVIRITTIPLGGDLQTSKPSLGIAKKEAETLDCLVGKKFILIVGTIEPRKGHASALDAFDLLFENDESDIPNLVIVGRPGWKTDNVQARMRNHPERGARFFWFDNASDELLARLYQTCSGVLFPTFAEGFGLPLVEALAYRRPVLVRDLPVFREISAPSVSYFSDDRPQNFADEIMRWQTGTSGSDSEYSDLFTWKRSSEKLIEALQIYF